MRECLHFVKTNMDQFLLDTGITGQQIETWLCEYFRRQVKLECCHAEELIAGGGFTSTIGRITVKYIRDESGDHLLPTSFILKVPSRRMLQELVAGWIRGTSLRVDEFVDIFLTEHVNECEFYRLFSAERSPIGLPVVYAIQDSVDDQIGAILMEDLSVRAAVIGDLTSSISLDHLLEVADVLADLHAWCMTNPVNWRERVGSAVTERRKKAGEMRLELMKCAFERVKLKYPGVFDQLENDEMRQRLEMDYSAQMLQRHSEIIPEVIVHGDFYLCNLIFEKNMDNEGNVIIGPKLAAIIDWPMCYSGCGLEDLAVLICFNVDTQIRRQYTQRVLKRYYDSLLRKVGIDTRIGTFDDICKVYQDHFILVGMGYIMGLDWWQDMTVQSDGRRETEDILFRRCLGVYEDLCALFPV